MRPRSMMLSLFAISCLTQPLAAQTSVGVRGGFTSASVSGDDLDQTGRRTGIAAAAFVGVGLSDIVSLEIGAGYTQKGVTAAAEDFDLTLELDYVELNAMLRVKLPGSDRVWPTLFAGPFVAREAGCHASAAQASITLTQDCDDPVFEGDLVTVKTDVGAAAGAGVAIVARPGMLVGVDALWGTGLRTIEPNDIDDANRNQAFVVTASVAWRVGG